MATNSQTLQTSVSPQRLWFGLVGSAAAWVSLGFIDILITWRACIHPAQFANTGSNPGVRAIYVVVAVLLFAVVAAAGITSYRNWRAISQQDDILHAAATERREFMALLGVFVSLTMGFGVVWLSIPPLMIELCMRAK